MAQSSFTEPTDKKWHYLTDVYLMFVNIDGETGLDNTLTIPIDANPGDIFSNLKIGGCFILRPIPTNGPLPPIWFL